MNFKLAIISPNTSQYSETFIRSQIELLPEHKVVFSGGYLPSLVSHDLGQSYASLESKKWWRRSNENERFLKSLQREKIDVVIAQYGQTGVEVMEACEKADIPLVVHFHGFDAYRDDAFDNQGVYYPVMFKKAHAIVAVSKDMFDRLIEIGCPEEKLFYIPYGVDTNTFKPLDLDGEYLLSVGRFVPKKGPLHTIRAFARVLDKYPTEKLIMVGDGPLYEEAVSLVRQLDLQDNVVFKGVLDSSEVMLLMQNAKMFLQHSLKTKDNDSEGTPLSIIEASAVGLPVVATRHAGIKDVIKEGQSGILVDEKDVEGMSQAMVQLLDNKVAITSMGKEGRRIIEEDFTVERYINQLSTLIHNCLKKQ